MTFLSVFALLLGPGYLWTRRAAWDYLSIASAEVGLLFCTLVLMPDRSGPNRHGASGGPGKRS